MGIEFVVLPEMSSQHHTFGKWSPKIDSSSKKSLASEEALKLEVFRSGSMECTYRIGRHLSFGSVFLFCDSN